MKRRILIVLLSLGTIGGFASGIRSMRGCSYNRRAAFEQHVARVCVDAARASDTDAARAVRSAPLAPQAPQAPQAPAAPAAD